MNYCFYVQSGVQKLLALLTGVNDIIPYLSVDHVES